MADVGIGKIILGVAVWAAVGVFAVIIAANVDDQLVGLVPVLAAVVVAWTVGERVVRSQDRG